jgi:hypothetical protein
VLVASGGASAWSAPAYSPPPEAPLPREGASGDNKRGYKCRQCGLPKKNHQCRVQDVTRRDAGTEVEPALTMRPGRWGRVIFFFGCVPGSLTSG